MTNGAKDANDDRTLTLRVPMALRKHGGRKVVLAPLGTTRIAPRRQTNDAVIKTLARAFRWRRLIENGVHATIHDLATAGRVNPSYASRILRLTLLAPDIVEEILDRRAPTVETNAIMRPFPLEWATQRSVWARK